MDPSGPLGRDEAERASAAGPAADPPRGSGPFDALRDQIDQLRDRLADAGPRRALDELDRAMALLKAARPRDAAPSPREAALVREVDVLRSALERMETPGPHAALAAAVEALDEKLDVMQARQIDPVAFARLQVRVGELADLVARALETGSAERLAAETRRLADHLARAGQEAARSVDAARLVFEDRAGALMERLEQIAVPPAPAPAIAPAMAPVFESATLLAPVEQQLTVLADGMRVALDRLARLEGVETTLGSMAADLAQLRAEELSRTRAAAQTAQSAVDQARAAEEAAAHAASEAQSAARAAADAAGAVAAKLATRADSPALLGVKRGLAALEARQNEIERRAVEAFTLDVERELGQVDAVMLSRTEDGAVWAPLDNEAPAVRPASAWPAEAPVERDADVAGADDMPWPQPQARADWAAAAERAQREADRREAERAERLARRGRFMSVLRGGLAAAAVVLLLAGGALVAVHLGVLDEPGRRAPAKASTQAVASAPAASPAKPAAPLAPSPVSAAASAPAAAPVVLPAGLPPPLGSQALKDAALAGNPLAAYEVGVRYLDGKSVPVDLEAAERWLTFAVARGSVPAGYRLGNLYERTRRDLPRAYAVYSWAAEMGNVRAMHTLGVFAAQGALGPADLPAAAAWFKKAAALGLRDAQYNLGVLYARGFDGAPDLAEAWKWFALAARQGDADSAQKRDAVAAKADAQTLARGRDLAAAFVPATPDEAANVARLPSEWEASQVYGGGPRRSASLP